MGVNSEKTAITGSLMGLSVGPQNLPVVHALAMDRTFQTLNEVKQLASALMFPGYGLAYSAVLFIYQEGGMEIWTPMELLTL